MINGRRWGTEDFDALCWHDAHVHGFRLVHFNEDEGCADLVMDIDFVLGWQPSGTGFLFTVCQAVLRFHGASELKLQLDYATPTAGMSPFMMTGIERAELVRPNGHRSWRWKIPISWPQGLLEFAAPDFTQTLVGEPHVQPRQFLAPEKRNSGLVLLD